jgi:hypothetical protein
MNAYLYFINSSFSLTLWENETKIAPIGLKFSVLVPLPI